MADAHLPPGTEIPPSDLQALVADVVSRRGPRGAGNILGIGRVAILGILSGRPVTRGTLALLREAQRRRAEHGSSREDDAA